MVEATVTDMYSEEKENEFLEVTYANGDREVLYFKDFSSGAMIENIVRRAKKDAIKRQIAGETGGIRKTDLIAAIKQEFREQEDLPNTTNPDDWAKISGQEGRADRLCPNAGRGGRGQPSHREGRGRPVPLMVRSDGTAQGARNRDRVRDRGAW